MKPCLQVVGSKVRMASRIAALFPPHTAYVEPYAGSAAVLLAKEPVPVETINDKNELLIAFYRTLRGEATRYRLIDALTYTPYARAELRDAPDDPELDDVERARRFMVRTNQSYVGGGGLNWTATMRGSSGHSNASKWNNFRTRLHQVAERLQNVQIENRDAAEVLAKVVFAHDKSIAVYVDPPYLETTRSGSRYSHEVDERHHEDLLALLVRVDGPVVLSGYPAALYTDTLVPAGWRAYEHSVRASSTPGRGSTAARTEVLWANPACVDLRPIELPDDEVETA